MIDGRGQLVVFSGDLGVDEWKFVLLLCFYRELDVRVLCVSGVAGYSHFVTRFELLQRRRLRISSILRLLVQLVSPCRTVEFVHEDVGEKGSEW